MKKNNLVSILIKKELFVKKWLHLLKKYGFLI